MQARLMILTGKRQGESLDLAPGEHQIGTGRAAAIQLRDDDVSFKHAKVVVEDGSVFLEDLKSKAGTFLNGERVDARVPLKDQDEVRCGGASMRIELQGAPAPAAEPEPAPPADELPLVDEAPAEEPKAPAEAPRALADLPQDPALLQQMVRDLRREVDEKATTIKQYDEALQGRSDDASADPLGYSTGSLSEHTEAQVLELQHQADDLSAQLLEKGEEIKRLEDEIEQLKALNAENKRAVEKQKDAMAGEVMRRDEKLESWREDVEKAKSEVARFEEVNAELMLENEEMKERLAALQYQLEVDRADTGAKVREKVVELQKEAERLEQSNAELRTLVEAYEEKIDELDERVEELEGEGEATEKLLAEVREELQKTKTERETMVKTLRQKVKRLEEKAEELQGARARAQGGGSRDADAVDEPAEARS